MSATREFALKAAAAAQRSMDRDVCCKSQFKFKCFSCGKMINRGDKITRVISDPTGMTLRYRGAGGECGLTMDEINFYRAGTGTRTWVHIGCIPCIWDKGLDEHGNRLTRPRLRPICTEWGVKVYGEWEEWVNDDEALRQHMDVPYFQQVKGYPKEKLMFDRIIHAVKRFQALWRGYLYKKAYQIARRQARATEAINLNARATLSTQPRVLVAGSYNNYPSEAQYQKEVEYWEQWKKSALATAARSRARWENWLQSEEGDKNEREDAEAQNVRKRNAFLHNNSIEAHVEVLFDERRNNAAIYSAEVIKIQGQGGDSLYYWVKYDHDSEVRKYHWKRLLKLKLECENFKSKHGIYAKIKGKLPLHIL